MAAACAIGRRKFTRRVLVPVQRVSMMVLTHSLTSSVPSAIRSPIWSWFQPSLLLLSPRWREEEQLAPDPHTVSTRGMPGSRPKLRQYGRGWKNLQRAPPPPPPLCFERMLVYHHFSRVCVPSRYTVMEISPVPPAAVLRKREANCPSFHFVSRSPRLHSQPPDSQVGCF